MSWGAVIAGGAAIVGGALSSKSAGKAANASSSANDATVNEARRQFDLTREDTANQRQLGNEAIDRLRSIFMGGDLSAVTSDPGYAFGLNEGISAIDKSAIANGRLFSGGTGKALTRYGTDYATTKVNDTTQRLLALAGMGNQGITTSANMGSNTTSIIAGSNANNAAQRGSAYMAGGAGVNNAIQGGISNYLLGRYLNSPNSVAGGSLYAWNGPKITPGLS